MIKQKSILIFQFSIFLLFSGLIYFHINYGYFTSIIAFFVYLILPGILVSRILNIPWLSFWENTIFSIGLSIIFIEFGGLLLNIALPLLKDYSPLSFTGIFYGFSVYFLILFIIVWKKTGEASFAFHIVPSSLREIVFYLVPIFFPILAAFGAIRLNNGGSNVLTMTLLGCIGLYTLCIIIFRKKLSMQVFMTALFFIALSLLFTTSLRGWFITGHDIQREYYVFRLTNSHHFWDIAFYRDAYNACLSITILPTVLTNMLGIKDIYIYKIIFQVLFAVTPVLIFIILKRFTFNAAAFLAAFYYMAFPTFFNDMPMLNRQEIGFIFFGLVLYVIIMPSLSKKTRKILFVVFGAATIVSHYSTNYVLLVLLTLVYFLSIFFYFPPLRKAGTSIGAKFLRKTANTFDSSRFIGLVLILIMYGMTFFWNTLYTHTSNNIGSVIREVITGVLLKSTDATKSGDVSYSIVPSHALSFEKLVAKVIKTETAFAIANKEADFYSPNLYREYPILAPLPDTIPQTRIGDLLVRLHVPINKLQTLLRSLASLFMQLAVFVGILAIFLYKHKKTIDIEFILISFAGIILLVLEIMLPALSAEYGLLRMFQQFLFVFSLLIVYGTLLIFSHLKKEKQIILSACIAILFFLTLTGFLSHVTGDFNTTMTLDNSGLYYESYYLKAPNIAAIHWLQTNRTKFSHVDSDLLGNVALLNYGQIESTNNLFPALIHKSGYVFIAAGSKILLSIQKDVHSFVTPQPFLDANKNLIYSNGTDNIYK